MDGTGATIGAKAERAKPVAFLEADRRCDPLCAANRVPMAVVAERFSAVAKRLYDVLALAEQRLVGTDHA